MAFMLFMLDNQTSHHLIHPEIYMIFFSKPDIHSMSTWLISKKLFLCSCQLGLCTISPIWCLGLWRCRNGRRRKTNRRNQRSSTLIHLQITGLCLEMQPQTSQGGGLDFHHTHKLHIASSSSCVSVWGSGHGLQHAGMSRGWRKLKKKSETESNRWLRSSCDLLEWCWQYASAVFPHCISVPEKKIMLIQHQELLLLRASRFAIINHTCASLLS